ncbi:MAG: hypothetical protein ACO3AF_01810 [Flavobacteriales bacterium]
MRTLPWFTPIILFFFLGSCTTSKETASNLPPASSGRKPSCGSGWLMDNELFKMPGFPLRIDSAYLDGRCLVVDVHRSGGCGNVAVELIWNGSMMKSMPPQIPLRILGRGEDPCRSEVKQQLRFEISTLNNGQPFIIQMQGWKHPLHFGQP